jgi:hypothetical protein
LASWNAAISACRKDWWSSWGHWKKTYIWCDLMEFIGLKPQKYEALKRWTLRTIDIWMDQCTNCHILREWCSQFTSYFYGNGLLGWQFFFLPGP